MCGWGSSFDRVALISMLCVLCVFFPFILDVRLVDVPAGVTQDLSSAFLLRCSLYFSRAKVSVIIPFSRRP